MPSLHQTIVNTKRVGEWDSLEEASGHPIGVTSQELSKLLEGFDSAKFIFVPASLVPDSETARKIDARGLDLGERYVVYGGFRRGVGHEGSYG